MGIGGDAEEEAGGTGGAQAVGGPWGEASCPAEEGVRLKKAGLLVRAELLQRRKSLTGQSGPVHLRLHQTAGAAESVVVCDQWLNR